MAVTKRQSCYLWSFIPVGFDVFNAVFTQECDEVLLLPFHIQGRRDTISYSQKALEFLMPLEISCSGALKYLGKTPVPKGLIPHSLPPLQLHTATSRALRCAGWMPWGTEQLSGADLLCCGIPRHSSPFPESHSLLTGMSCCTKSAPQAQSTSKPRA